MTSTRDHETLSSDDVQAEPGTVPWLCCVGSPEDGFRAAGAVHPLVGIDRVRFGRGDRDDLVLDRDGHTFDVRIPQHWVSRDHARLELDGERWRLHDQGSRNGVFVGGAAVEPGQALAPGEVFELGRSFWALQWGPEELAAAPLPVPHVTTLPGLRRAIRNLERLATADTPIVLVGETGTGKGTLARWLHERGRPDGELVVVELAAGSIERQLLGGGPEASPLSRAAEGTLVLDDVDELDGAGQAELSSVLLGHVPRADPAHPGRTAARVVATSGRDLRAAVVEGSFRADLSSRLDGYTVALPPLRLRRADLGALARGLARDPAGNPVTVAVEVFRAMLQHEWPFNLRQLEHTLRAAAAVADGTITFDVWQSVAWDGGDTVTTPRRLAAVRHELLQQLSRHEGRLEDVASALGCTPHEVERWLRRFALRPGAFGPPR